MSDGVRRGVRELADTHREGRREIAETVEELIAALAGADPAVFIAPESAERLRRRAQELSRGPRDLPLLGVPFAVKDNIDVAGLATTAACPGYGSTPPGSARVVRRLEAAGAIVAGKTNLDQFATGLVGTRTPHGALSSTFSAEHISGGSSSGSAIAVAAGLVPFSLGTDTAGSGRVPAAFNDLVGMKPTRGLLSTAGVIPACRTLDCVSIFAHDVEDAEAVLSVAKGFDAADAYSRRAPTRDAPGRPATLGLPLPGQLEFFGDERSERAWERARATIAGLADRVVEVDLVPFLETARLLYEGPWVAERYAAFGAVLERDDVRADPIVREIVLGGRDLRAVDAFRAEYRLADLRREAEGAFAAIDALMLPTAPTFPTHDEVAAEPIAANARLGAWTNFVNLLDLAALAVPGGLREDGLPFGVTFIAPAWSDKALLRLGSAWRSAQNRQPPGEGIDIAVVGAHLTGMPRNHELVALGARYRTTALTAPSYRLFDLDDGTGRPGLIRDDGSGASFEVEVWQMAPLAFARLVADISSPLSIGTLELTDGRRVKGFLCEEHATRHATEVTGHDGWRAYRAAAPA